MHEGYFVFYSLQHWRGSVSSPADQGRGIVSYVIRFTLMLEPGRMSKARDQCAKLASAREKAFNVYCTLSQDLGCGRMGAVLIRLGHN